MTIAARGDFATLTNKSGGDLALGILVVDSSGNDSGFTTTTTASDQRTIGILAEAIANNASGKVQVGGVCKDALVDAAVTRYHYLISSTTAGKLSDSGIALAAASGPPVGACAIALETIGAAGAIDVLWLGIGGSVPSWVGDTYRLETYPTSPNAIDDEFEGGGAVDVKWTKVNDPAGANALNQTDFEGFLHVGLPENATDTFANMVQLYQTAPAGAATATYVAKISLVIADDVWNGTTDAGEFCGIGMALINSVNSEAIGVGLQANDAATGGNDNLPFSALGFSDYFSGFGSTVAYPLIYPGQFIYVRLRKTTANAYTSANTYQMDVSGNGVIWQTIASGSKTFTTAADRIGFMFRFPKSQTGAPKGEALIDFFRKTA